MGVDMLRFNEAVRKNAHLIEGDPTLYELQALKAIVSQAIRNEETHIDGLWDELDRVESTKAKRKIMNKILSHMALTRFMRRVWFTYYSKGEENE